MAYMLTRMARDLAAFLSLERLENSFFLVVDDDDWVVLLSESMLTMATIG